MFSRKTVNVFPKEIYTIPGKQVFFASPPFLLFLPDIVSGTLTQRTKSAAVITSGGEKSIGFMATAVEPRVPEVTGWGGCLFRRFRNMFSESSPCLLGQHGSCSKAQQPGNSQKTFYKTFGTSGRPTW